MSHKNTKKDTLVDVGDLVSDLMWITEKSVTVSSNSRSWLIPSSKKWMAQSLTAI